MKDKILLTVVTRNNPVLLSHLVDSIEKNDAGFPYDLLLLDAESDNIQHLNVLEKLSKRYMVQRIADDRVEASYNVAWEQNRDYKYYLFMHDDCHVERENWLKVFVGRMNSGHCEEIIKNTHLKALPIGKVCLGNQFYRSYTSVLNFPVQCVFLEKCLELLYPDKVPKIFKYCDCDICLLFIFY